MVAIERFYLEANSLHLEAVFSKPLDRLCGAVVLCHPNPSFGGDMYHKVVVKLAELLLGEGHAVLRFNFRGTGKSTGTHEDPSDARQDLAAALDWLTENQPGLPLALAGYSYGAFVALSALVPRVAGSFPGRYPLEWILAVAYPAGLPEYRLGSLPEIRTGFVHGEEDELIPASSLKQLLKGRQRGIDVQWVEGANHFFDGKLDAMQAAAGTSLKKITM